MLKNIFKKLDEMKKLYLVVLIKNACEVVHILVYVLTRITW